MILKRAFQSVEKIFNRYGYRILWSPKGFQREGAELRPTFELVVAHYMLFNPSPFFIQIGANDGIANDPLNKFVTRYHWRGILLEPLPDVFEKLKKTYSESPQLQLLNAALADKDGVKTIYTVRMDPHIFQKAQQLTTFRKETLLSHTHLIPDIASRIEEREVQCLCFDTLLSLVGEKNVDILQTDAEGYDYTILKMIDFNRLRPAIVAYEHRHMTKDQQEEIAHLLIAQGYAMTRGGMDTIGYRAPGTFN
jgi:FkbM family methyltransferase